MAILVAGGCGYIGSHVSKLLKKRGYDVVVYDNLSHGYRDNAQWGEFVMGDIGDSHQLDLVFQHYKIDAVMHFCAFIEVGESVIDPEKYYKNNIKNTINMLEAMRRNNIDKFIFSSTAAVYGMPERIPIQEDDAKIQINPYGNSKWMVEQVLDSYASAYGFNSIRFRYFNAAGCDPDGDTGENHVPETHLIPLILDAAIGKRDSIKIFGTDYETKDGTCVRDYVHVNDLADAHIKGVQYLLDGNKGTDYFNLGSGEGYTVKEMIDMVKKVTKKDFKVVEVERRPGDPAYLIADSSKVKKKFGWKLDYDLEKIISTAWNWHQKLQSIKMK